MDKTKASTVICDGIILEKLSFERKPNVPDYLINSNEFNLKNFIIRNDINYSFNEAKDHLTFKYGITIKDKDDTVVIICSMVALFLQKKPGSVSLEEYSQYNAPAFVLPYIRQAISDVTLKGGLLPLILPPINVHKMVDEAKKEKDSDVPSVSNGNI